MTKSDAVAYRDYVIYPLAVFESATNKWRAMALVTRDTGDENLTLPRSKSFPQAPGEFDDEAAALSFAVKYGQTLVDRMQPGNAPQET